MAYENICIIWTGNVKIFNKLNFVENKTEIMQFIFRKPVNLFIAKYYYIN